MSNIKDVNLLRHAWDTPSFLLIVSPTPPVQSVDVYAQSITWQQNEKQLTISMSRARGSPANIQKEFMS